MDMKLRLLVILAFLMNIISLLAYDTEIDGLRYDWVSYYNASKTSADVSLVGYSSSKLGQELSIPCFVNWNESREGAKGRNCQVGRIGIGAFKDCTILKSINLSCVESILTSSFENCTSLQTIYFSNSIISVGPNAFKGCSSLMEIHIDDNTPPNVYEDSFEDVTYKNATLYVPEGKIDVYRAHDIWSKFQKISDGSTNSSSLYQTPIFEEKGQYTFKYYLTNDPAGSMPCNVAVDMSMGWKGFSEKRELGKYVFAGPAAAHADYPTWTVNGTSATNVTYDMSDKDNMAISKVGIASDNNTYKIIALADKAPDEFVSLRTFIKSNGTHEIRKNHLYETVGYNDNGISSMDATSATQRWNDVKGYGAIPMPATHAVPYDESIDLSTYVETHYNYGNSLFDQVMSDAIMKQLGLEYRYTIIDYRVNSQKASESAHIEQDANKPGVFYPRSVDSYGNTIKGQPATREVIDREPLIRVDLVSTKDNNSIIRYGYIKLRIVDSQTTYTVSISSSGNGSASYNGTTVRGNTSSFTVNSGSSATITFSPDNGYRIKSVKVNNTTISVSNNHYIISNINANTTVSVEFEAIPVTTYTLSITASGNGSVSYNGTTIRNKTTSFTVDKGTYATITFSSDKDNLVLRVKVNGSPVPFSNNEYRISNIKEDINVEVVFTSNPIKYEVNGLNYIILSDNQVEVVGPSNDSENIEILEKVIIEGKEYVVTQIADNAFYRCSHLTGSLIIPNSITTIGNSAFYECSRLSGSLTIPNTVTKIGDRAFYGCSSFSGPLTIPNSVKTIGSSAFMNCSGFSGSLTLPNSLTTIGSFTFYKCSGFTGTLKIPNTVTTIESSAFDGCVGFTGTLIIPNTVTTIESSAFAGCVGFTGKLTIPNSVIKIEGLAFLNCSGIVDLLIPNSVNIIGNQPFRGCSGLASITVEAGNGLIDSRENCNAIINSSTNELITGCKNTVIPSSVVSIGSIAFYSCLDLKEITIPSSVTSIGVDAFGNCNGLKSIIIPSNVVNIGKSAFYGCSNLTLVKSLIVTPFDIDNSVFNLISSSAKLEVPQGTKSKYQALSGWTSGFKEIIEFSDSPTTYTLSISASGNGSASYSGTTIRSKTSSYTLNAGSSATITFNPDNGYRIKSVKVNNTTVSVSNNQYTISSINSNTTVSVEFEAIPVTTYTLSITASGSGSVSYGGSTIRSKTSSFTLNEGSSATITFSPDNGYRIKSVKVNNSAVSFSNNQYTISSINADTTVSVEFEAIPQTTYTLSITASGNGSASYGGSTIRSKTSSFTLNEGSSASISFTPDNGYRIKSVKVNNSTVSVSNNQYTISSINANTTVSVEFEAIPPTTYTLSITASGNGSASYSGTTIRSKTSSFTLNEGTSATITFSPDNGYRIKTVKVNGSTVSVSNNQYTVSSISKNTTVEVEFEAIPVTYSLSITATGNGSASYDGTTIRGKTSSFIVNEGTTVKISITPDNGYRIKSVKENNTVVTSYVSNGVYTINNLSRNTTVEVEFEEILQAFSADDVNFTVVSFDQRTIRLAKGCYGITLEVPAKVSYQNAEWTVTGIDNGALANNPDLAAVVWNPDVAFTEQVSNPNFLLYVNQAQYAPSNIKNVVVNGNANSITLMDAASGNNFHCPQTFTAQKITYTHNYSMKTGIGKAQGWETIALPFDVQKVTHESKGEIISFANWRSGDSKRPFWLMQLSASGWTMATSIKANTPYIISMPNNDEYKSGFLLNGKVTFSAENVSVAKTENLSIANYSDRTFVPTFASLEKSNDVLALNVVNDIERVTGGSTEGSTFERNLRPIHPFEAYMTSTSSTRSIGIDEGMATGIIELISALSDEGDLRIYNLNGQLIKIEEGRSLDEVMRELPAGVYIVNGKKMIIR